jgi:hypothetical protein
MFGTPKKIKFTKDGKRTFKAVRSDLTGTSLFGSPVCLGCATGKCKHTRKGW